MESAALDCTFHPCLSRYLSPAIDLVAITHCVRALRCGRLGEEAGILRLATRGVAVDNITARTVQVRSSRVGSSRVALILHFEDNG